MAGESVLGDSGRVADESVAAQQLPVAEEGDMGSEVAALAEFPVSGMRSQRDADVVTDSLMRIAGVRSARADHYSGRARVGFDPSRTTIQTIRETAAAPGKSL
jgi:copper chaperone CopZ